MATTPAKTDAPVPTKPAAVAPKPEVAAKAPEAAPKVEAAPVAAKPAPVVTAPKPVVKAPAKAKPRKSVAKKAVARKAIVRKPAIKPIPASKPAKIIQAAKTAVTSATAPVVATVKKEIQTMATKFETPKMMTEMSDRAKVAMEKSGKFVAEMNEFNKGNVEALVESGKITAKGLETMGQNAADYSRKSFEGLTATLKSLASVKSPTEFFKLQSDYVRSSFDAAVAEASKSTEMMMKLAGDAAQPISSRFAVAAEKAKIAA